MTLILDGLTGAGMSKIEEVGDAIMRFRNTGKPVIAVADGFNQDSSICWPPTLTVFLCTPWVLSA